MHVDEYIDSFDSDAYASWVLNYFRAPAAQNQRWWPFMKAHRLFCTYGGKRYRVTGASRMGDVWLAEDWDREAGYDLRVEVGLCGGWRDAP